MECYWCDEEVRPPEAVMVFVNGATGHTDCVLRSIAGSVVHQRHECSCFIAGSTAEDPPEMTKREAATLAANFWKTRLLSQR